LLGTDHDVEDGEESLESQIQDRDKQPSEQLMGRKPSNRRRASPKGIPFELAVKALQEMLDPSATVTHNEHLIDRLGHRRQFDVVIRAKAGGHDVLGVIECKDLSRPVGTPEVNAFADKARNVRANITLLVSRKGFTKQAIELARHHGIGTFSLLKRDTEKYGLVVGVPAYGEIYFWNAFKVTLHYPLSAAAPGAFELDELAYDGCPVGDWIISELHRTFTDVRVLGWHTLWIRFHHPTIISLRGEPFPILACEVAVERKRQGKSKQIQWSGQAFYDWQKKALTIPGHAEFVTEGWRADFADWDDFEGDFPQLGGRFIIEFRISAFKTVEVKGLGDRSLAEVADVELLPPAV
jgi:hypothetical protein